MDSSSRISTVKLIRGFKCFESPWLFFSRQNSTISLSCFTTKSILIVQRDFFHYTKNGTGNTASGGYSASGSGKIFQFGENGSCVCRASLQSASALLPGTALKMKIPASGADDADRDIGVSDFT